MKMHRVLNFYYFRPVTAEVAGSSPVVPANKSQHNNFNKFFSGFLSFYKPLRKSILFTLFKGFFVFVA